MVYGSVHPFNFLYISVDRKRKKGTEASKRYIDTEKREERDKKKVEFGEVQGKEEEESIQSIDLSF
jgi:hypothetical protein